MKPQKQLNRHLPEQGIYGDCHRTAIAIVLDMDAKDVPHFMDASAYEEGSELAHGRIEAWLNARGFVTISVPFRGQDDLGQILQLIAVANPVSKPVYILRGRSRSGGNHAVVCCDGVIACDPSLDAAGIVGPCNDGHYWLTFFGALVASDCEAKHHQEAERQRDRMDRAATRLAAELVNDHNVRRGDFYITIGAGELHVYAKPEVIRAANDAGFVLPKSFQGCALEWHEAPVDIKPIAEAAE
ncbi:hypothetical protein [Bradyrhizobium sp. ORS 86]|uniref:hypothetical protein n=1 Tax=Bradyrhizobium sp. ORS 86 TaxID=1685970 RepID=UPI003890ACDA